MGITDGFLVLLGLEDGTLQHMKTVANSVSPEHPATKSVIPLFKQGAKMMTTSHGHLESSVDKVVTGWKGSAASAASSTVIQGAMASSESSDSSVQAQAQAQAYTQQMAQYKAKINAIPDVDTSMSAAVHNAGGPAAALMNPGAVAANMAAAQGQALANREEAAGHLNDMNDSGHQSATQFRTTYTAIPAPGYVGHMPSTISVQPISSGGGSGSTTGVPATPPGSPGPSTGSPGTVGGKGPTFTAVPTGPDTVIRDPHPPVLVTPPKEPPIDFGPGTTTTGVTTDPNTGSTPVALPEPVGAGGGGLGGAVGIGAGLGAAGGAIAMAGGLNGVGRGALAGRAGAGSPGADAEGVEGRGSAGSRGLASEEEALRAGGRAGMAGEVAADGSVLRGNGAGEMARNGLGGARGFGGAGEETPLRASGLGSSAGELAAGERGAMPPGMGSGARRGDDEDELNRRPDYLVETDDLWGDGRLAAPPVLG